MGPTQQRLASTTAPGRIARGWLPELPADPADDPATLVIRVMRAVQSPDWAVLTCAERLIAETDGDEETLRLILIRVHEAGARYATPAQGRALQTVRTALMMMQEGRLVHAEGDRGT